MKIQKLETLNSSRKTSYMTNSKYNIKYNLSFGSKEDVFVKSVDDAFVIASQALKQRLQMVLEGACQKINYSSTFKEIEAIQRRNTETEDISKKYQIIIEALKKSSKKDLPKDAEAINNFITALEKLGKNEGFNKVFGYQDVKTELENKFILEKIMLAKTSQDIDVPNAVFLYGLPCNGKSFFASALAEHTLSHSETIDLAKLGKEAREKGVSKERLAMDKIIEYADIAERNYINNNKQRTIIIVNEADSLAKPSSPVHKEFIEFIKTCSKEKKCTLFLTSNYPEVFDKSILAKNITPFKIGIEPANKENCKAIICGILSKHNKMPDEGIDVLVDAFFKNPEKTYSNGNIVDVINNTINEYKPKIPLIKDYLEAIKTNNVEPSISKEELNKFYITKDNLEKINW